MSQKPFDFSKNYFSPKIDALFWDHGIEGHPVLPCVQANMTGVIHPRSERENSINDLSTETKDQLPIHNLEENKFVQKSLGFIPLTSSIRQKFIHLVSPRSWFNSFILSMIIFNSISMAIVDYRYIDDDYNPRSDISLRNRIVEILEYFFTLVFALEFVFKVVAHGFIFGERTYLKDHWNKLDFVVVLAR